jgi:hypothetical protein
MKKARRAIGAPLLFSTFGSGSALADDSRGRLLGLGAASSKTRQQKDCGNAENDLFHLNDPRRIVATHASETSLVLKA